MTRLIILRTCLAIYKLFDATTLNQMPNFVGVCTENICWQCNTARVQQVEWSVLLYEPSFSATIFSALKIAVELANAVSASYAMASNGLCR